VAELRAKFTGAPFAVLGTGAVTTLLPALAELGVEPESFGASDMGRACGHLQNLVAERTMTHSGDPLFAQALQVAVRRDIGDDLWTWSRRKSGDISPLVAGTGALWLLENDPGAPAIY
jgi:phage terminase large subunit-like protein